MADVGGYLTSCKVEQELSNPLFDVLDSHKLAEESHTHVMIRNDIALYIHVMFVLCVYINIYAYMRRTICFTHLYILVHVGIYTYCRRISTNIVLRSDADDVSGIVQLLGSTINS